eukprot:3317769-Pyramimonas_sp.AAC.1
MGLPRPVQRFVAPSGAPPKAPVAVSTCASPTQHSASWFQRELHIRRQWRCPHASPPPSTGL